MTKKIISLLLILSMLLSITCVSFADSISDIQEKKKEAENQQKEVKSEKSAAMKEVEELTETIEETQDKLDDINANIVQLNKEIKTAKKELEEAQEKHEKQEEALKQKMIVTYEMGKTSYLDFLLNSKGVLEFLSNYYLISEILQNDNDLLEAIEEEQKKIEKTKKELETKQKEAKTKKAEQEKINVVLSNQKKQQQNKVASLTQEEKKLADEIASYNKAIRELEEAARRASQNSTGKFVGGVMLWPCPSSTRISSGFGPRKSPGGVGSTNHKGIDIAASRGSSIVASLDGKVIQCGYNRARGYYVMIDHGGGIITIYQHGLEGSTKVSVGQTVKQGQTILNVGMTGYSTGYHLHFEVWKNGTPVNPMGYLQ